MPTTVTLTVERDVPVPMRDGTVLYADVYRPRDAGPLPVLLQRTPYNKALPANVGQYGDALRFAAAGYAVVIQDTRGRYASEGTFYPFRHESDDGYDTVEWCAAQPWSTGNVGMFGASYVGATQWLAALARPPHLRTIVPMLTPSGYHEGWTYHGGAFALGFNLSWALLLALETALRGAPQISAGPQMEQVIRANDNLPDVLARLPVREQPELQDLAPYYTDWLDHPGGDDAYWRRWIIDGHYDEISIPVFTVGGWYDLFLGGTLRTFEGMGRRHDPLPRKLLVGPWCHGDPWLGNRVGQVDFGLASAASSLDLDGLQLRWFDQWVKGVDTGIIDEPAVRIFVMGTNTWRDERQWPLARGEYTDYYFHSDGSANSRDGDGVLNRDAPAAEPPDRYVYDPADPVPTQGGGLCCAPMHLAEGAFDQRASESRPDVLVYTSRPLDHDLEVTGPVHVTLWVASSAAQTDWTAKLVDVDASGGARNLTDGILRVRDRPTTPPAQAPGPAEIYECVIDLWATSTVFKAGHRIRVDISSSNFPRFDRNLNSGQWSGDPADTVPAWQRVYHDEAHPSRITLPIIPEASGAARARS